MIIHDVRSFHNISPHSSMVKNYYRSRTVISPKQQSTSSCIYREISSGTMIEIYINSLKQVNITDIDIKPSNSRPNDNNDSINDCNICFNTLRKHYIKCQQCNTLTDIQCFKKYIQSKIKPIHIIQYNRESNIMTTNSSHDIHIPCYICKTLNLFTKYDTIPPGYPILLKH